MGMFPELEWADGLLVDKGLGGEEFDVIGNPSDRYGPHPDAKGDTGAILEHTRGGPVNDLGWRPPWSESGKSFRMQMPIPEQLGRNRYVGLVMEVAMRHGELLIKDFRVRGTGVPSTWRDVLNSLEFEPPIGLQ